MMMEMGVEASFPVAFFDGEVTMDMGNVLVDPSLDFKSFRSIISQKIGVSPHQITIYLERKVAGGGGGRRIPVTNKFNFGSVIRERNCFFFVVSKRSRRVRRRKNNNNNKHTSLSSSSSSIHSPPPRSFDLLCRNAPHNLSLPQYSSPPMGDNWLGGGADYLDYTNQMMRALEVEKERYLMSLNLNSNVYDLLNYSYSNNNHHQQYWISGGSEEMTSEDGASSSGAGDRAGLVCEVCTSAKMEGKTAAFHWCKCDAVVTAVFRSPAGPIARPPTKRSGGGGDSFTIAAAGDT